MTFTDKQLYTKANNLFTYFETCCFKNELSHSRRINLVLEFCEYIEKMSDWELLEILESEDIQDASNFRKIVDLGADLWLGDLIKTIAY